MPPRGRRPDGASGGRSTPQQRRQDPRRSSAPRRLDQGGPTPPLALAAASVDGDVSRNRISPTTRATFQAVALLVRELREKTKTDPMNEARRAQELKRIEGLATALARTAAKQTTLLTLLTDDAARLPGTATILAELRAKTGLEAPDEPEPLVPDPSNSREQRSVIPDSVRARVLANPFLAPDYSAAPPTRPKPRLLVGWELLQPLLRSFEESSDGAPSCMALPEPTQTHIAWGRELMPHQAQVVAAAREGHRTFLLADEPGLGKTAQALLAAQASNSFPLLVVVPNVVKTSWAREAAMWTPKHGATVIHGDGETADAFNDIVIINYDILDRHVGWLGRFGFRGMVVDEAHFIKNKTSQRSQHVLDLSRKIAQRTTRPLLMALTGTPLINDIEDFLAIWEFLGWITEDEVGPDLLHALEANGRTPLERSFYPAARQAVTEMGIVRRRKVDVAKDIPARRIADMPVELDGALGTSVRAAERKLA